MSTTKLYASAPLKPINNDEERLEEIIKDIFSLKNFLKRLKDTIIYFIDENHKSRTSIKKLKFYLLY